MRRITAHCALSTMPSSRKPSSNSRTMSPASSLNSDGISKYPTKAASHFALAAYMDLEAHFGYLYSNFQASASKAKKASTSVGSIRCIDSPKKDVVAAFTRTCPHHFHRDTVFVCHRSEEASTIAPDIPSHATDSSMLFRFVARRLSERPPGGGGARGRAGSGAAREGPPERGLN